MGNPELIKYIRSQRARYSDERIRARLLQDGLAEQEIDEAFKVAVKEGPRPGPARMLLILGGTLFVAGFFLVVLSFYCVKPPSRTSLDRGAPGASPETAGFQAEIDAYRPELLSPFSLPRELVLAGQDEGNAGADYLEAGRLLLVEGEGAMRELLAGNGPDEKRDAAAIAALERGVLKRENRSAGILFTPSSQAEFVDGAERTMALAALSAVFGRRAERYLAEARPGQADAELRKKARFGYHLLQDWDPSAQLLGMSVLVSAVHAKEGRAAPQERLPLAKLVKDIGAYVPQKEEIGTIAGLAADGTKVASLARYLDEERLRRPYAVLALLLAAEQWSPAEASAAKPSDERARLFAAAAESADLRVAALGKGYARLMEETAKELASLPKEKRLERLASRRELVAKLVPSQASGSK